MKYLDRYRPRPKSQGKSKEDSAGITAEKRFDQEELRVVATKNCNGLAVCNKKQMEVRDPPAQIRQIEIEKITGKGRDTAKWEKGKSVYEVQNMGPSSWLKDVPL